jgi:hypothetical protein
MKFSFLFMFLVWREKNEEIFEVLPLLSLVAIDHHWREMMKFSFRFMFLVSRQKNGENFEILPPSSNRPSLERNEEIFFYMFLVYPSLMFLTSFYFIVFYFIFLISWVNNF